MIVQKIELSNFRNIGNLSITPDTNINVIYGNNAQGKTNLLESIWLFTGGRSFRGAKDRDLIRFLEDEANLEMDFFASEREQNAKIKITKDKRALTLNDVDRGHASSMVGKFCSVIFSPVHLSLIKDGPAQRRKFIDAAICQIKPTYAKLLSRYNHILSQRNTLLKEIKYHKELRDTMEIWDDRLAKYGAELTFERINYIKSIEKYVENIYYGISCGKESFKLQYISTFLKELCYNKKDIEIMFKTKLQSRMQNDMQNLTTSVGPHRDDIEIFISDKSARLYASQGQQRSAALSLKLAEGAVLRDNISESPVILLDDVMSELDSSRQDYILNSIKDWQVFITCCDPGAVSMLKSGKQFKVSDGQICSG